jgi:hypothetical protein
VTVIAWIVEGTWPACVDAARAHAPEDEEIVLLHVSDPDLPGIAHGAFAGLLGRGHPEREPGTRLQDLGAASATALLNAAAEHLDAPAHNRKGRDASSGKSPPQPREPTCWSWPATATAPTSDPRSLGPASRFVLDHAPCPVLLVWPEPAPGIATVPPLPPHPPHR